MKLLRNDGEKHGANEYEDLLTSQRNPLPHPYIGQQPNSSANEVLLGQKHIDDILSVNHPKFFISYFLNILHISIHTIFLTFGLDKFNDV